MPAPSDSALIDAVNDRDHVIGRTRRGSAPTSGTGFRTVHVFVRDGKRLLLQRLAPSRDRHPGLWGSSVAGYLYAGESYREAAERRQREELGLTGDLYKMGKIRFQEEDATKFVTLFRTIATDVEVREPEHIAEVRWWDEPELAAAIETETDRFTPTLLSLIARFGAGDGQQRSPRA